MLQLRLFSTDIWIAINYIEASWDTSLQKAALQQAISIRYGNSANLSLIFVAMVV